MKRIAKFFVFLLLTVMVLGTLTACSGGKGNGVAGTYPGDYYKFVVDTDEQKVLSEGKNAFSLVLDAKGNGTFKRENNEYDVTWKLDGENFTMSETFLGVTNEYSGTLKGGILSIFNGDPEKDTTCNFVFAPKQ